jgi:hypothetical protein
MSSFCRALASVLLSAPVALVNLADAASVPEVEKEITELFKSGKLFEKTQYKAVRGAFARLFEQRHAEEIKEAFGDDYDKLNAYLDAHTDLKHNFYTAIDERFDKVPAALMLFKELWKKFPEGVEKYPNLAIAVAVVWDDASRGVYDYRPHQIRAHASMPPKLVDGLGNFEYLVANEKITDGRLRFLPWEFLTFVVDHRTPLKERGWAQSYYQASRGRAKSWHQDVPYDNDMLKGELDKSSSRKPRLEGREYTLANLKSHGGVCAHQADFASRVAKSVGIPAVWCWGASTYRGLHAWWMFVQVQSANADQLKFTLVSDGRIAGFIKDQLFTGNVTDPQTTQQMLDRDMERRLWVVGRDPVAKRHAELVMRAYPWLCVQEEMDPKAKVAYLDRCLKVSPHSELAWLEFASLCRLEELDTGAKAVVSVHLASLYKTFAAYPDFVARLMDDLLKTQPDPKEQIKNYEQAVALFEKAGRPDLACAARLKITDLWVAVAKWQTAGQGLITTIRKFPTEGRFVPQMTKKMQEVAGKYKDGPTALGQLYVELIPAMIIFYGKEGSGYCDKLSEQAIAYLRENKLDKHLQALRVKTDHAKLTDATH